MKEARLSEFLADIYYKMEQTKLLGFSSDNLLS